MNAREKMGATKILSNPFHLRELVDNVDHILSVGPWHPLASLRYGADLLSNQGRCKTRDGRCGAHYRQLARDGGARSSAEEHFGDIEGVVGSIPTAPTISPCIPVPGGIGLFILRNCTVLAAPTIIQRLSALNERRSLELCQWHPVPGRLK